ncbi:ATP-grasp domain-containing protein [Aquimarina agarilytica]|uniref:ATP-grasp domain-containing protein n=1 Tax=Aquimarina agarilytica TaxID=1087449 RepID=UPI000289FA04|nr:ATP-grasp domain-containing protein [Aquimarina agarilytica]
MDSKTVLVTGIGGNVGQGILRNIRSLERNIKLIGTDISAFTAGNHLCDKTFQVPYSYEENYIRVIQKIVDENKVALIIPSTDYEIYYLSLYKQEIKAQVLSCDNKIAAQFLDKYLTFKLFKNSEIPFAKSWLPSEYDNTESQIIVKPRKGRGSRGITVNPKNISDYTDDYMIQKLHLGIEITTAVYVTKKNKIHGICSMERKLDNGTTSQVIFNNSYDAKLMKIASKIVDLGGVRGSFNIQSIVDVKGEVTPFEINARISGTNSIRHALGFQDVKYSIQEYLFDEQPAKLTIKNTKAIAVRVLMDVIYPEASTFEELNNRDSKHFIY